MKIDSYDIVHGILQAIAYDEEFETELGEVAEAVHVGDGDPALSRPINVETADEAIIVMASGKRFRVTVTEITE